MFFCRRIIKLDKMSGTIQGFSKELTLTVKCFFGFEETLKEELIEYGFNEIELLNRAVQIKGTWKDDGNFVKMTWDTVYGK